MNKMCKRIISVFLAAAMLAGLTMPSFAQDDKTAFIVVSGMNTFPLYENEKQVFPMTGDVTAKMIAGILPSALTFLEDGDYGKMADGIIPPVKEAFASLECDVDGNSVYNVTTKTFDGVLTGEMSYFENETSDEQGVVRAGVEKFGAENTFFFNYDWRLDPLDHADSLNDFIKNVRAQTGCDRIALAAFSMGGTVTLSYLYKYGSADVDSVILCSTAFQGTSCVGSLFTGDLQVDMSALIRRLAQLTRKPAAEDLILYLGNVLEMTEISTALEKFVNGITGNTCEQVYSQLLTPVFGHMAGLWALVDDVNYEQAKAWMLDENENAKLIERADEYHYNVQSKAKEILASAQNDTNVYIVAQYNMQGLPVSQRSSTSNNDYLIDTVYASGGAVCADLDTTLGDGYKQAVEDGYDRLSADGQIDASTCMFPEYTWFIRDMGHVDYPVGESTDFILYLAGSEEYVTVHDNESYPQFMKYDYASNTLTAVDETVNAKSFTDVFFSLLKFISEIIVRIFSYVLSVKQ